MPNGGKGAIAKIYVETEVIDNFKQQAAKIKSGLGNSLKDIKDLDLNFGFNTDSMAKAAGKELDEVMRLATSQKLERLDFSGIFPGLTEYLKDNSIADELKLQVVQGLRKGLEDFSRLSSTKDIENLIRIGDGTDVWSNLLISNATKDVINSFGLKRKDSDIFLKQFRTLASSHIRKDSGSAIQDLQQLLSIKATADNKEYQDVIKYLISGKYTDARSNKEQTMFNLPAINDAIRINDFYKKAKQDKLSEKDIRDFAGFFGRLQYLTTTSNDEDLHEIYNGIIGNEHFNELFNPKDPKDGLLVPDQLKIFQDVLSKVIKASQYKDVQYQAMDKQAFKSDISQAVNALFAASGDNGTIARLTPLIHGWENNPISVSADELLAETIKSLHMQFEDNGLKAGDDSAERAERAAGRAEKAADRAETASETAVQAAEDIRQAIEDGTPQTDGKHNDKSQSQEASSTQSDNTAEHIADSAEADAENTEHIAETLEEKKERLENGLVEIRNKAKSLKDANKKYRKAIEETYNDIKTPEEALQLLKEKSAQLQQTDSEFKGIESKRNSFTDPKNNEELTILEEYNQKRANLEQAIIEYNKAGRLAVDRKVNPEDIRQNLVDEERLSFDSRGDYIDHLKQVIADNEKDIKSWEDLITQYQGQLDEVNDLINRQQTGNTRNIGNENPQQNNAIDQPEANVAREEVNRIRKTREELQAEREKLAEEIQQSSQTMDEAEQQITSIDKNIKQTQQSERRNDATINKLLEEKEQIESQIRQTEDELKTIKERLQDAVDAKQSTEEEIRTLNEQFFNTDSLVVSADSPENSDRYNQLTDEKRSTDFDLKFNQEMLEQAMQEQEALEKILKGSYSTKTLNDAYKQAMARKKEYIQLQKEFEKRPLASEKFGIEDIGSANYMLAVSEDQEARVKVDKAWMAYYKAFQEFESHGRNGSGNKEAMKERLLSGIDSHNLPVFTSLAAETVPAELEEELKTLNAEIEERKKEVEETQKKADELQQQINELSSHIVTKDDILQKIQEKEKEQQKFEQEEDSWTTQQYNKQIELEDLNKQLNGTRGVTNHLKTTQEAQQNNKEELQRLQQQRDEQQRIYDEAKAVQEEKARQLEELDRLIAETEARESAPPSTPATGENNGSNNAIPPSEHGGEESPVVQNVNQQLENLKNEEQQLKDKLAQITDEKQNTEKIVNDINNVLNKDVSVKTAREAYNNAQLALINASTRAAERFDDRAPRDKNSNEWKEWLERNKEIIQQEKIAWIEYYKAMEEFESHGGETASKIANRRRLQPSDAVKHTREDWGFTTSEDLKQQLQADLQAKKELLASYKQQEEELNSQIAIIQQKKEQVKTQPPLSSSGAETANGVQEEGAEAGDAATKMEALAKAKKEALEANRQLAESADTTTNAIQNESNSGNFDELVSKLIEAAKLLGQLPQSFEGFKSFDLEPLNNLSQAIQQFPKEGFNISLGDSFNNLANNIDKTLQKVQELTSQATNAEIESTFAEKYDEQIRQLKTDVEEAKRVIEELKKTKQDATQKSVKKIDPISQDDKAIATEYENLKQAQNKLFSASNIIEYNSALQETKNILQRIYSLEQEVASKYAGQSQVDLLLMGYGDDPLDALADRLPKSTNARNGLSISRQLSKEYIEQQKTDIQELSNSLKSIQIVPDETRSNWSKKRREEYDQIVKGAQTASQAVEKLSAQLTIMETNSVSPEVLKTFLQLKDITTEAVKNTQNNNNNFNAKVTSAADALTSKLTTAEERLKAIQSDSKDLIYIDPNMQSVLDSVAKHLEEIKKIKDAISNNPLEVINPKFTQNTNEYLTKLNGENKEEGIISDFERVADRSQTDFNRTVSNYSRYATALNKLFTDLAKGSKISADQLSKDFIRISDLSSRLVNSTGLQKNNLLTGELNAKADPTIVDAQTEAADKTAIAFESMFTKIINESESAKLTLKQIFGTEGLTKGLSENFIQGTAEGFDIFVQNINQAGESLKRLEEIQKNIKNDRTWILQEENAEAYRKTSEALANSLKQISNNAGNFRIVDALDVQKLRASTTQFIKDNPALTGGEISELTNYINQLQGEINSVDFKNIENGIRKVKQDATEAGHTGETFFSLLTKRLKSLGAYLLSFASFYRIIGVFKDGLNIIKELDTALTEMNKVSTESLNSLKEYQKESFDMANGVGTTAVQLQQSTADFIRLGKLNCLFI